jgi:hypothetical protein
MSEVIVDLIIKNEIICYDCRNYKCVNLGSVDLQSLF